MLVTTGTASGKTLAFNLPVLDALAREPKLRALYLYPTKALAQDQFRALAGYRLPYLRPAIYDGDTPAEQRAGIRRSANVILTNPDLVHIGLLPNHDRWGDVLANLRYVVIDEAHVYRGVFGSHVANVLRRLRRLARIYGADPQFLLASATISNPGELGLRLLGTPVTVIGDDAAPRSERTIVLWNPPLQDAELGLRASALAEAAKLQALFVERGLRTLTFAKSRKAAELIHRFTAERLGDDSQLSPYRAGYTPVQRREIERRLAAGELLGVSSTNALELGIDIGLLDVVISVGFPGTVASLRQQWGRAGRRDAGLAVLVASEDALDQYFMREPDALLGRRVEAAILDHTSARVLAGHVRAAAYEAPLTTADEEVLGPEALAAAHVGSRAQADARRHRLGRPRPPRGAHSSALVRAGCLQRRGRGDRLGARPRRALTRLLDRARGRRVPASRRVVPRPRARPHVALRGRRAARARLVHAGQEGDADDDRGAEPGRAQARAGALFRGDRGDRAGCRLRAQDDRLAGADRAGAARPAHHHVRDRGRVVPARAGQLESLEEMPKLLGTLHAAEHALIALLPLWAMCDRWDIGGLSTNVHPQTGRPTVFVYDGHPGGIGIAERGFEEFEGWVADTAKLLRGCPCADGCPSCVQSPKCGNLNDMLDKHGALTFLERSLSG